MLFQLKKLPEIINLTRFLKSFWILYIDQIIVYYAFYSKLTFYILKDRCQMHTLKVFRSPVWLLPHKLSSPHYRYIRKMRRGDRLPLTQIVIHIRGCLGFTTTYAISAYHHLRCEFESRSWRDVIDTTCDVAFDRSVVFSVYYGFLHQYN
jgi:hypothetical protein